MQSKLKTYFESEAVRHYTRVVAFAVLTLLLGGVLFFGLDWQQQRPSTDVPPEWQLNASSSIDAYTLATSKPMRLRIPSINVDTTFEEPLGLNDDRSIEVPDSFEQVGWYQYGPTPGELGPSVVLGHVDSYEGPAVFFSLGQLDPGDEIYIDRADGTTATFTVESLERHEQSGFPTKKVYSDINHAGLRLITCSGTYDRGEERYTHNLIVFARLNEPEEGEDE